MEISTNRIEAFSDGVIAIIITVMVFDLKFESTPSSETIYADLWHLLPRFISYGISFLMLAIMWVNHHQLFHEISKVDNHLLWLNINLLFWMSLIPFVTNFIGSNPLLWQASALYSIIFAMAAYSFTIIRNHIIKRNLLKSHVHHAKYARIKRRNYVSIVIYLTAGVASMLSPYFAMFLLLLVPIMYFVKTYSRDQDIQPT